MKNLRKILVSLMAVVMMLGMCFSVNAAGTVVAPTAIKAINAETGKNVSSLVLYTNADNADVKVQYSASNKSGSSLMGVTASSSNRGVVKVKAALKDIKTVKDAKNLVEEGLLDITPVSNGTATVTVKANGGKKAIKIKVTVATYAEGINLGPNVVVEDGKNVLYVAQGGKVDFAPTAYASTGAVSNGAMVVKVTDTLKAHKGYVTYSAGPKKIAFSKKAFDPSNGGVEVTVSTKDGKQSAKVYVKPVAVTVSKITLVPDRLAKGNVFGALTSSKTINMKTNPKSGCSEYQLTTERVALTSATDTYTVSFADLKFTSKNPGVATVDATGKIVAVGAGKTEIRIGTKTGFGAEAVIKVNVTTDVDMVAALPNKTEIYADNKDKATVAVKMNTNATNKKVKYTIDQVVDKNDKPVAAKDIKKYATVDAKGNVKAKTFKVKGVENYAKSVIVKVASVSNPEIFDTCIIEVKPGKSTVSGNGGKKPSTGVTLDKDQKAAMKVIDKAITDAMKAEVRDYTGVKATFTSKTSSFTFEVMNPNKDYTALKETGITDAFKAIIETTNVTEANITERVSGKTWKITGTKGSGMTVNDETGLGYAAALEKVIKESNVGNTLHDWVGKNYTIKLTVDKKTVVTYYANVTMSNATQKAAVDAELKNALEAVAMPNVEIRYNANTEAIAIIGKKLDAKLTDIDVAALKAQFAGQSEAWADSALADAEVATVYVKNPENGQTIIKEKHHTDANSKETFIADLLQAYIDKLLAHGYNELSGLTKTASLIDVEYQINGAKYTRSYVVTFDVSTAEFDAAADVAFEKIMGMLDDNADYLDVVFAPEANEFKVNIAYWGAEKTGKDIDAVVKANVANHIADIEKTARELGFINTDKAIAVKSEGKDILAIDLKAATVDNIYTVDSKNKKVYETLLKTTAAKLNKKTFAVEVPCKLNDVEATLKYNIVVTATARNIEKNANEAITKALAAHADEVYFASASFNEKKKIISVNITAKGGEMTFAQAKADLAKFAAEAYATVERNMVATDKEIEIVAVGKKKTPFAKVKFNKEGKLDETCITYVNAADAKDFAPDKQMKNLAGKKFNIIVPFINGKSVKKITYTVEFAVADFSINDNADYEINKAIAENADEFSNEAIVSYNDKAVVVTVLEAANDKTVASVREESKLYRAIVDAMADHAFVDNTKDIVVSFAEGNMDLTKVCTIKDGVVTYNATEVELLKELKDRTLQSLNGAKFEVTVPYVHGKDEAKITYKVFVKVAEPIVAVAEVEETEDVEEVVEAE